MILTGITDEAGALIDTQIKAVKELGWNTIEARSVEVEGFPKANLHDIADEAFDVVEEKLKKAGVGVYCFGSTIANWGKKSMIPLIFPKWNGQSHACNDLEANMSVS